MGSATGAPKAPVVKAKGRSLIISFDVLCGLMCPRVAPGCGHHPGVDFVSFARHDPPGNVLPFPTALARRRVQGNLYIQLLCVTP